MSIASEITRISQNVEDSLAAVANKGVTVPAGSNSDDLPGLIAQIQQGSGSGITINDVADSHGGYVRHITGVSLAGDTVTAATLLSGYTAHNSMGEAITGTYTPSVTPTGTINIGANGTYDVAQYASANVQVSGGATLQAKTNISPTTSSQTITPDSGYDGLSSVQINAMPTGVATAPTSISGSSASVSTGTNTITLSKTVSVTPRITSAGYVSSGTAGNSSVSLTASVTTKAATTYHPSTTDQTIASGTYTTGTQTIKAVTVSGLSANTILSGTTVKIGDSTDDDCVTSVSGSVTFQTIYSGSSNPSASTGVNGDIYVQT